MKKSTKGAVAAGAAAVLLLGGAGSLAYWTAENDVEGGIINAGDLDLINPDCDPEWVYATGFAGAGDTVVNFAPGDVISKTCDLQVVAVGDNLEAFLNVPTSVTYTDTPSGTSFDADVAADFELDGTDVTPDTPITDANNGDIVTADIVVTIPFGVDDTTVNGNDTKNIEVELDTITVTLEQQPQNP